MNESLVACPHCGVLVYGGSEGCQALKTEVGLIEISDPVFGRLGRLSHDIYCVQHEERYCGRAKGLIGHLGGLCIGVDYAGHPNVYRALQRWLDHGHWRAVAYPPTEGIPFKRGDLTIADVRYAMDESPEAYERVVKRWACTTWDAFGTLHDLARGWVAQALTTR